MDVDRATQTMIENIPARTGRPLAEWFALIDSAGLTTHGAIVRALKEQHGMSHGFANLVAKLAVARDDDPAADLLAAQFAGRKEGMRPVYAAVAAAASAVGGDVEVVVRKSAVAFRRAKQFAYVEIPSATRVRVGLNLRGVAPTERLRETGGMCTHGVDVTEPADVDDELRGWLAQAYGLAG